MGHGSPTPRPSLLCSSIPSLGSPHPWHPLFKPESTGSPASRRCWARCRVTPPQCSAQSTCWPPPLHRSSQTWALGLTPLYPRQPVQAGLITDASVCLGGRGVIECVMSEQMNEHTYLALCSLSGQSNPPPLPTGPGAGTSRGREPKGHAQSHKGPLVQLSRSLRAFLAQAPFLTSKD